VVDERVKCCQDNHYLIVVIVSPAINVKKQDTHLKNTLLKTMSKKLEQISDE
jgi:hypothetical protein